MSRKTPTVVKALLARHQMQLAYITEVLRVKDSVPVANQAVHVQRPRDYWIGRADGINAAIEDVLAEHKCYNGFAYVRYDRDGTMHYVTADEVKAGRYAEWSRFYPSK